MQYDITYRMRVDAVDDRDAAIAVDRFMQTVAPKDFEVTPVGGKTIFVRVQRGEAKRIA